MKTKEPFNKKNCAYVHKVAAGDTLYKIARRYGVDYGRLMALNGITNPYQLKTGMEICIPPTLAPGGKNCAGFYIIGEGDTLYSISRRFGVSLDDLMAANSDIDPYNMHIGMKLCIPPKNTAGTPGQKPQSGQPGQQNPGPQKPQDGQPGQQNPGPQKPQGGQRPGQQNPGSQRPQGGQRPGQQNSADKVYPRESNAAGGSDNISDTADTGAGSIISSDSSTSQPPGSSGAEEANFDSSLLADEANFDSYVVKPSPADSPDRRNLTAGQASDSADSPAAVFTSVPAAGVGKEKTEDTVYTILSAGSAGHNSSKTGSFAESSVPVSAPQAVSVPASDMIARPYVSDTMPDGILYRVEQGETLTDILRKFGICFSALDYCNSSVDFNQDLTGLTLNIPYGDRFCVSPNNQPYVIRRNDTLDTLSLRFDISTDDLLKLNPTRKPEDFSSTGGRINISDEI